MRLPCQQIHCRHDLLTQTTPGEKQGAKAATLRCLHRPHKGFRSGDGLFKILPKIGCPPKLLSIIRSFHKDMKGTVVFDGSTSAAFNIRSGVKQGCVLAPTLFGIFLAVMLKHTFGSAAEGIYLRTRTDGKLFNLSRLRAKTKVQLQCLRDFLFTDDAAVTAHSAEDRGRTYAKKLRFLRKKRADYANLKMPCVYCTQKTVTSHIKMPLVFSFFTPSREGL